MKKNTIFAALVLPLAIASAHAQTSGARISGFGTGALTVSDEDKAEFARPNQSSGVRKDPRTGVDSNLGLQADYAVNDWLSLTGQGLVRKDGEDNFGAELSWAFAKFKLSDQLSVRAGRMGLPAFMISDYRNVGYANTFVRPPSEVYSQVPLNSVDGVDLTWAQEFAGTTFTAQLAAGRSKATITGGAHADASDVRALNLSAERGPFTLRFGRTEAKVTIDDSASLNTLVSTFDNAGNTFRISQLNDIARLVENKKKKGTFTSVGLSMDWNNIVAQTEYAKRKLPGISDATDSWYAMAGYRIGKLLPYYTHAKLSSKSSFVNTLPTACATGAAAACTPTVRSLRGTVDSLRANALGQSQSTDTLGLRWDFASSADIKFQVDRIKPQGKGLFVQAQPGFKGPVLVGTVAVDFVF
ncbi:hypothetical protein LK542_20160 [Massilia sp. IC2-477]|uniref:hypothetical protein n=1 Tax=Massilia sp. IC2-477 TaxID=2887198 RepID=UPI001D12E180|nr:hypothetical protein [Massilia sp. IC2-477]MCC2957938.1 hypothetical protein [Massilia sp. IC2-477]